MSEAVTQSKKGSAYEVAINIVIGFSINYLANWWILPLFGFHSLNAVSNFEIGVLFTVISVARQYVIRRWCNQWIKKGAAWMTR